MPAARCSGDIGGLQTLGWVGDILVGAIVAIDDGDAVRDGGSLVGDVVTKIGPRVGAFEGGKVGLEVGVIVG